MSDHNAYSTCKYCGIDMVTPCLARHYFDVHTEEILKSKNIQQRLLSCKDIKTTPLSLHHDCFVTLCKCYRGTSRAFKRENAAQKHLAENPKCCAAKTARATELLQLVLPADAPPASQMSLKADLREKDLLAEIARLTTLVSDKDSIIEGCMKQMQDLQGFLHGVSKENMQLKETVRKLVEEAPDEDEPRYYASPPPTRFADPVYNEEEAPAPPSRPRPSKIKKQVSIAL